jgi:hypothetical protein
MVKNKLEYRMYGLVNYQLSGTIHAGIQFGHGVVEYAQKYFKDKDYQEWAKNHKTFIILNGGTTNNGFANNEQGRIQNHFELLKKNKIKHSVFFEPDLNNALTAVCFLVDERVFNRKKYPDLVETVWTGKNIKIQKKNWLESIGGKENAFLRDFLKDKKLA